MFPEYINIIEKLKVEDKYFEKMFHKHNDLDDEIALLEKNHANQFDIETSIKIGNTNKPPSQV